MWRVCRDIFMYSLIAWVMHVNIMEVYFGDSTMMVCILLLIWVRKVHSLCIVPPALTEACHQILEY